MKLLEAKQVINSMFATEWTETAIQWYGYRLVIKM